MPNACLMWQHELHDNRQAAEKSKQMPKRLAWLFVALLRRPAAGKRQEAAALTQAPNRVAACHKPKPPNATTACSNCRTICQKHASTLLPRGTLRMCRGPRCTDVSPLPSPSNTIHHVPAVWMPSGTWWMPFVSKIHFDNWQRRFAARSLGNAARPSPAASIQRPCKRRP